MAKAKTLPFKIYVKAEDADGTTWLNASEHFEDLAESGELVKVTVYHRSQEQVLDCRPKLILAGGKITL